jgi:primase-polymerase (primpol)-like protein|tara:strand:- start:684 stop:998 length:315 start_codon:yes stop_codon:yes gene_type:complete
MVESIVSKDYNSGYTYSVSGTGVEILNNGSMIPDAVKKTGTTDGVSYSWTGLDFSTKPTFVQTENGAAFQLSESYMGPGLSNVTTINRQVTTESTTITQSIFQK